MAVDLAPAGRARPSIDAESEMKMTVLARQIGLSSQPRWSRCKPLIAAVCSGLLIAASFVPWNYSILAWIAWIPLMSQVLPLNPEARCEQPFRLGFITGLTFWLSTIYWLHYVTFPGMLALATFLALYFGLWTRFMACIRAYWRKPQGWHHIYLALFGASGWVTLEWMRGWVLGGFPWNNVAVSQHQNLVLIQIAEWTGMHAVSFVIVYFNISFWLTWRRLRLENFSAKFWRYELSAAILLVAFCIFLGMRCLLKAPQKQQAASQTLKVALIQPNIPQDRKYEPLGRDEQLDRFRNLSVMAAATKPDLIFWPETAIVDGPSFNIYTRHWLHTLIQEIKTPILFGTIEVSSKEETLRHRKEVYYNAAAILKMDGALSPAYRKIHLVPFGEYVPWENWIPWLRLLTPIQATFGGGEKPVMLDFQNIQLGTAICFEDTFPYLTRGLALHGADILVNLTNDAWFKDSPAAEMHASNAIFRCIETRRPMIRCTNHGISQIVGPLGNIIVRHKPFQTGFQYATISFQKSNDLTFYTRFGDWFVYACILISLSGLGFCWRIRTSR